MITRPADAEPSPSPVSTVLVVDGEVLVRLVIAEYLRTCGYRVHEAVSAAEALAILQSPEASVDIVFSEAKIPGDMDGFALARWVRANKPGVEVLLTSTIDRSAEVAGMLCETGPLLEKPYAHQSVVDRIKQLLAKAKRG
jgi:CheY-like chemotaxis protein